MPSVRHWTTLTGASEKTLILGSHLDSVPNGGWLDGCLGVIAFEEQRLDVAQAWFRRAIDVDPRNGKTHFLLAKTLLANGNASGARGEIDRALELMPAQPEFVSFRNEIQSLQR